MNRNLIYFVAGALAIAVLVLGYMTYQDRKEPEGLQINLGKGGVEIKNK